MSKQGLILTYMFILGTMILTGTISQQSIAQTTTTANGGGGGGNTTSAATTTALTGINATTNGTAPSAPTPLLTQPQQPSPFIGEQFKIVASDTRFPGSQFIMVVNSTGALRNIIGSIAQQPLTGLSGQGPMLLPPPGAGPFANDPSIRGYIDQIINDILRMRATATMTTPPGAAAGTSGFGGGSLCYDIGWYHVCVERS
jgi:hypothetical protein